MNKVEFFFDFETRSNADLIKVGAVKYAVDLSTAPYLLTYAFGRSGIVKKWYEGEPIPAEIKDVAANPNKYLFLAFNLEFDYLIWCAKFIKICGGGTNPALHDLLDVMGICNYYKVGGSLEAASKALGFQEGKDKEGGAIMRKMMKPRNGAFHSPTAEEKQKVIHYGKLDTELLRAIYYKLPPFPESEAYLWRWTFHTNITGIAIDTNLVNVLQGILDENLPDLEKEYMEITKVKVKSVKSQDYFRQWVPELKDLAKATVRDLMIDREKLFPPQAQRALEIKAEAGSSSIAKIPTIQRMLYNGRVYGLLQYAKAQTLRWSGSGVQIQNFPRPDYKAKDKLPDLERSDVAQVIEFGMKANLQEPIAFVKNLLRRVFVASKGLTLYSGDWSKMEPTVLYWLLDLGPIPKLWYEDMAAAIYNIPVEQIGKESRERALGKEACLGGGYGMGARAFRENLYIKTAMSITMDESKNIVYSYRNSNPKVIQFWSDLENAFARAIKGDTVQLCNGRIIFTPMTHPLPGVMVKLPANVYLHYPHAKIRPVEKIVDVMGYVDGKPVVIRRDKKIENSFTYLQFEKRGTVVKSVYGGLLCENVVSATARCCMGPAIFRLQELGFHVIAQIHDEIIAESYAGRDQEFEDAMCYKVKWQTDMEIKTEAQSGVRYLK